MNAAQNRTGSASAASHDSQKVSPPDRAAAQLDSRTILPAPADPATRVSRWPAPVVSRSWRAGRATSVLGSVVGRNFAIANRAPDEVPCSILAAARILPTPKAIRSQDGIPPRAGAHFITRKV